MRLTSRTFGGADGHSSHAAAATSATTSVPPITSRARDAVAGAASGPLREPACPSGRSAASTPGAARGRPPARARSGNGAPVLVEKLHDHASSPGRATRSPSSAAPPRGAGSRRRAPRPPCRRAAGERSPARTGPHRPRTGPSARRPPCPAAARRHVGGRAHQPALGGARGVGSSEPFVAFSRCAMPKSRIFTTRPVSTAGSRA